MTEQALPPSLPAKRLLERGPWVLLDSSVSPPPGWVEAFSSVFEEAVRAIEKKWPLPAGIVAHVVLGGHGDCRAWGVDEEALAFHAICATSSIDGDFSVALPDDHRCYINLATHQRQVDQSEEDNEATRLSALTTLPHEMARLAWFVRHTQGQTPHQIAESGGGEHAVFALHAELDEQEGPGATESNPTLEDPFSQFAANTVENWRAHDVRAPKVLGQIVASPPPVPDIVSPRRRWLWGDWF